MVETLSLLVTVLHFCSLTFSPFICKIRTFSKTGTKEVKEQNSENADKTILFRHFSLIMSEIFVSTIKTIFAEFLSMNCEGAFLSWLRAYDLPDVSRASRRQWGGCEKAMARRDVWQGSCAENDRPRAERQLCRKVARLRASKRLDERRKREMNRVCEGWTERDDIEIAVRV